MVLLVEKVALLCSTKVWDYTQLNKLPDNFSPGLVVLVFPCNSFLASGER
jgi:glutathione peroxidase-family protein